MRLSDFSIFSISATALLAAAPSAARADAPPAAAPAFAMMDNTGDGAEADLSLPFTLRTHDPSGALVRPRLLLQGFLPDGLGAYGIAHAVGGVGGGDDLGSFLIGGIELGGLYRTAITPHLDLGVRAGIATTTHNGNALFADLLSTLSARPADVVTALPATWLRLGVSPTLHQGMAFARVDLGVDTLITDRDSNGNVTFGHANLGVGVTAGHVTATAELQSVIQLDGHRVFDPLFSAGASVRYTAGRIAPYVAVSLPVGGDVGGDFVSVTGGVSVSL